jgi:SAM-dependent methyltransferase
MGSARGLAQGLSRGLAQGLSQGSAQGSAQHEGDLWGRHAEVWARRMETQMRPVYVATLAALHLGRGDRFLDAGCGAGLALAIAADSGADLTGLDASSGLLEVAAHRLPTAHLEGGDLEDLPFATGRFDAVTAFNAIQYAASPARAVSELARVCRLGGSVAIGIWGDPDRCETDGLFQRLRSLAPARLGTASRLDCTEPGVVEWLLSEAGLQVCGGGEVPIPFQFADLDDALTAHSSSGMVQRIIDAAGAEVVRSTIAAVLEADRKPDGGLRQDNVFRYVLATKRPAQKEDREA